MAYMRQRGLNGYQNVGDWSWEYYPPPYDFLAPRDARSMPAPFLYAVPRGVGGCGCGGRCGACQAAGLGLFDSGLDMTQWGFGEWAAVGIGAYLISSLLGDAGRAGRGVGRAGQAVGRKIRKGYRRVTRTRRTRRIMDRAMGL